MSQFGFVGRTNELQQLSNLYQRGKASLAVIKGRRRIGKTRLISEFAKNKKFIRFSGIAPTAGVTAQAQREVFAKQLETQCNIPGLSATNWSDLFTVLANYVRDVECVIAFDEISWMAEGDATFLGKLKNAWDMEFVHCKRLVLVLCGSVSTWIDTNIIKSTAFFGRISLYITLKELPLIDCAVFLKSLNFYGNSYEVFKLLSVTGGVPWYLEQIQGNLNADDNIKKLCFTNSGLLTQEFALIFNDLFGRRSQIYRKIIEALALQLLEISQIQEVVNYPRSGVLSEYLSDLQEAGFITRDYTWLLKSKAMSRLSHFRLSDNYLRFYLKYIAPNKDKILRGHFADISISNLTGWNSIMGVQFENLVLNNRVKIRQLLGIKPEDIVADNPFFQRKSSTKPGCQIDYLIQTRFNMLYLCEIKFSVKEIGADVIEEVKSKIDRLGLPRGFGVIPVLIHVNGVKDTVIDSGYFSHIIDFSTFLS